MYSPQILFSYVLQFHQPSFKRTKDQTFPSQWNIRQFTIMIQLNPLDKMNYSYKEKKKIQSLDNEQKLGLSLCKVFSLQILFSAFRQGVSQNSGILWFIIFLKVVLAEDSRVNVLENNPFHVLLFTCLEHHLYKFPNMSQNWTTENKSGYIFVFTVHPISWKCQGNVQKFCEVDTWE